jgi:hypothetical protein
MSSLRYVDPADGWDWWGCMEWPPELREFDPAAWPAVSVQASWRRFVQARRAAAPRDWRLARVRAQVASERLDDEPVDELGGVVVVLPPDAG